ncbi:MAG: hypothetical protein Q9227_001972 [Pyrenula ochraceoflavens]
MPLYEVEHICNLSPTQQDDIAKAITEIHSRKFTTASFFVRVKFMNVDQQVTYVAGKRKPFNRIVAHVRHGPSRTKEDYDDISKQLTVAWKSIVGSDGDHYLHAVFVMGDLNAMYEEGFILPPAGQDRQWLKVHLKDFQKRAAEGDEEFQNLIQELKNREDMQGTV